jgi:hypothetical protein
VSVTVEPGGRASSGGSWSAGDAFGDALGVLEVAVGVLVIALGVLISVMVLLIVACTPALDAVEKRTTR